MLYDVLVSILIEAEDASSAMRKAGMALNGYDVDFNFMVHSATESEFDNLNDLRTAQGRVERLKSRY